MRVLVTFALENEFAPWRALRKFRRSTWGTAQAYFAEIGASEVGIVLTGVGSRQAALETSKVTWREPDSVEFVISSGLAGALRPQYEIGQILVARTVAAESSSDEAVGGILESSAALISFAEDCGATAVGRFYTAERVVSRAEEKRHLGASADAVEMESFQVLLKARAEGIPAVAIRAISDAVDEDLPLDMNEIFTVEGEVSIPRVLGQVALHPQSLPELVRLGRRSKRAAESLVLFLDRYIADLGKNPAAGAANLGRAAATGRTMSQTIAHIGSNEILPKRPDEMRAGVYRGKGRVVVETVPIPEIGEGEVLFRVAACGICGTDIKKIHHGFLAPPQILGHELAGTVTRVGRGVTKFKPGDRVVSFHHIPCGACFYCEHKLFSQCAGYKKVGLTAGFDPNGGGFAEYVRAMPWIVEAMSVLPPDVSFEEATFVEPVNTCLKAVRKARVAKGETVLVIGQGPIGMLLMMLAKHEGAAVYTSDPMRGRRTASLRFGAAESFDPAAANLLEEMRARTSGRGADVVLLAVPNPSLVPEALAIARPGGRVLLFAHNDPVLKIEFPAAAVGIEEKEILGSYSASVEDQAESAALVFKRQLPLREMISHRFPLEKIADGLELAAHPADDTLKVIISQK